MTNKWFKTHDPGDQIDAVVIDAVSVYSWFSETGDSFIQTNPETMENSFELISSFPILDKQEDRKGKFQFTSQPGDHHSNFHTKYSCWRTHNL